jgi:hypothetical protein
MPDYHGPLHCTDVIMGHEKRKNRRQPVHYRARLELRPGRPVGCVLTDVSDTGARLMVPYSDKVPERFVLWLNDSGLARRTCQVVWRKPHQIGVRFERRLPEAGRAVLEPVKEVDAPEEALAAS